MTEESVSHDDLDAAWENAQPSEEVAAEEPVEEIKEKADEETEELPESGEESELSESGEPEETELPAEPELPGEPEDNAERSKLGRKVQYLETELTRAIETINELKTPAVPVEEELDEDAPVTRGDIEKIIEKREAVKAQQVNAYSEMYNQDLVRLGLELEEKEHLAVLNAAEKIKNPSRTGNPTIDAQANFLKAQNSILKKQIKDNAKPKNPLDKNKDTEPENLGGGAETKTKTKSHRMPKLDESAKSFVKSMGWDSEKVNEVLSGDTPLNLVNPKGG